MPLKIPSIDDRKYQELLDEALARIPVHNPEWTNFNKSDPGVTLIEVFAFLTENLLYRCNQIPERNRRKFLSLLGIPLQPASSARGLITLLNERGPLQTITLNGGLEVRAGEVPFYTKQGLDLLPVEAEVYFKRLVLNPPEELKDHYRQLYASYMGQPPTVEPQLYETIPLASQGDKGVDLTETVDGSLWIALLVRQMDKPFPDDKKRKVREEIAGKTLSLGVVPLLTDAGRRLPPGRYIKPEGEKLLKYEIPSGGPLLSDRKPRYRLLDAVATTDILSEPGIVQINLPSASEMTLWDNLDPLESGVDDFPPSLEDTTRVERLITWLRISAPADKETRIPVRARFLWAGINAALVAQRALVSNEILPSGTGKPDQMAVLSKTPVIPGSVRLTVTTSDGKAEEWKEIDDLMNAGPEVPVPDLKEPPSLPSPKNPRVKVFTLNPESGEIHFGDGLRGARPPWGAVLRADYAYSVGFAGNVRTGSINSSPALPTGIKVNNPVRTWGGSEGETVGAGEKQISRYLQHRDRLINISDFETITLRTPGVDIGRVEVIPAFNPELSLNEPGDAPGAVTVIVIPKYDPLQPDAPVPNRTFLDTICAHIDSRRLVTTEVFLRGPAYKDIWVSIGIEVIEGFSIAQVREGVREALRHFLSPLPKMEDEIKQSYPGMQKGWPLRKPVVSLELSAVAGRVPGVSFIKGALLAEGNKASTDVIEMRGLDLPRIAGISVVVGDPLDLDQIRGAGMPEPMPEAPQFVPVPVIPEECR